jgi:hypothetical protein
MPQCFNQLVFPNLCTCFFNQFYSVFCRHKYLPFAIDIYVKRSYKYIYETMYIQ